jgi:hypothetical protein
MTTMTTLRRMLSREARAARAEYRTLERGHREPQRTLARTADPAERAAALNRWRDVHCQQSDLYDIVGGTEEEMDLHQSHRVASHLIGLLADVEHDLDLWRRLGITTLPWRWPLPGGLAIIDYTAAPVLDRMVSAPSRRFELLDDLYEAVLPVVGGQAAETIACIPYPSLSVGELEEAWRKP